MAAGDLVLALTGASGMPYGVRLLETLLRAGRTVHLSISPSAAEVIQQELNRTVRIDDFRPADLFGESLANLSFDSLHYHHFSDFRAGIASGSFLTAGMVVCPCSMGTAAAIAHERVAHHQDHVGPGAEHAQGRDADDPRQRFGHGSV